MKYTYNYCMREKKMKNTGPNVKIVPVFWKSPDELSKRLSLPVCQGEGEKAKRKKLQNLICYEIASHKKKVKFKIQEVKGSEINHLNTKHRFCDPGVFVRYLILSLWIFSMPINGNFLSHEILFKPWNPNLCRVQYYQSRKKGA